LGSIVERIKMRRICLGLGALLSVSVVLSACEYVWEDQAPKLKRSGAPQSKSEPQRISKPKPVTPPDVRPTLAPGEEVSGMQKIAQGAKRLNLTALRESGELVLASNIPGLGDFNNVVDEFENTLSKSDGTNPFIVSFTFKTPRKLKGVKVLSTYSDYKWAFSSKDGKRFVTDVIIDGQWSTIAFKEPIVCSTCQVEVLRVVRDNFVHLNEIEFYE
jgi:hypothetical protein